MSSNNTEITLEQLYDKVILHKGEEYLIYGYKEITGRSVLYTDKRTIPLYWSELQEITILRNITQADRLKANEHREGLRIKQEKSRKTYTRSENVLNKVHAEKPKKEKEDVEEILDDYDVKFIIENWASIGTIGCFKELEVKKTLILEVVKKYDLRTKKKESGGRKKYDFTEERQNFLRDNWETMTIAKLSERLGVSSITCGKLAKSLSLPNKTRYVAPKVHVMNDEVTSKSDIILYKKYDIKTKKEKYVKKEPKKSEKSTLKIKTFDDSEIEFIRSNWTSKTIPFFCEYFGLSVLIFKRSIINLGLPKKKSTGKPKKYFTPEQIASIKELWEKGKSPNQIQIDLNITYMMWRKNFDSLGLEKKTKVKPIKERGKVGKPPRILTDDELSEIRLLWGQGRTKGFIQSKFRIAHDFWKRNSQSWGLPERDKKAVIKVINNKKTISESLIASIKEMRLNGLSDVKIRKQFNISYYVWSKNIESLDLPKKTVGKRTFNMEDVKKIRENWMHKPMEWFLTEFGMSYSNFNKSVKDLKLPVKRKIRTGKKNDKPIKLSKSQTVENTIQNYKDILNIIIESQSSGKTLIFKKDGDVCVATDESGAVIWSENQISSAFSSVNLFNEGKPWNEEDDKIVRKSFLLYNRNRNVHIIENEIKVHILEVFPIRYSKITNIDGYKTIEEFFNELSRKIGRRESVIRKRLEKFGLMEIKDLIVPENITTKNNN